MEKKRFNLVYALGIPLLSLAAAICTGERTRGNSGMNRGYNDNARTAVIEDVPVSEISLERKIDESRQSTEIIPQTEAEPVKSYAGKFSPYDVIISREARKSNGLLDEDEMRAQIKQESGFKPNAVSKIRINRRVIDGAMGLAQFMPDTAREMGYGPREMFIPEKAIEAQRRYNDQLFGLICKEKSMRHLNDFERRKLMYASYNAGFKNLRDACRMIEKANSTPRGTRTFYDIARNDKIRRVDISCLRGCPANWVGYSRALRLVTGKSNTAQTTGYVRKIIQYRNDYKAQKGEWKSQWIVPNAR